jgi:hypothetical protein
MAVEQDLRPAHREARAVVVCPVPTVHLETLVDIHPQKETPVATAQPTWVAVAVALEVLERLFRLISPLECSGTEAPEVLVQLG